MLARIDRVSTGFRRSVPFGALVAASAIAAAAVAVAALGVRWGTFSAGGADSYGYVSQAALWLRADLVAEEPLARQAPWTDADWTFAPLGYRPGVDPGTIVPVYPAGLPIVMAVLQAVAGARAVFWAVPLLAAAAVLATATLAWRVASPLAGVAAAWLLASRSIFVYATMWPMSDVAGAAWWAIALALAVGSRPRSAVASGVAAGMAILTRPNLAPVALAPGLYLVARLAARGVDRRVALQRVIAFGIPAALAAFAVALIHTRFYGSPLRTGYGEATRVFSAGHASSWLSEWLAHPLKFDLALVLLGLIGAGVALVRAGRPGARAIVLMLLGVVGLVLGAQAFYFFSPDWWYLRLLLPLYPPLAALGGVAIMAIAARWAPAWRTAAVVLMIGALAVRGVWRADDWRAFDQRAIESRYEAVGRFVRERLPERSAFVAFQQSGSLRYYANRLTVRFERMPPGSLDAVVQFLRERGYRPFFVIEDPEADRFKERFRRRSDLALLDWPPLAELRGPVGVRIFDPFDRARWYEGAQLFPERIELDARK
jgi:hypothetical protein